ncbi:MAG TPA: PstS family phosphate ABC transporter substrate-binding protein [Usitatibacter sp.]|jgi:phosphate transport system substrate-binding protein|nr:PstS family phosphate ABC transporter substrate-binding protein [Usitatibacter sp.]
MSKGDLVVSRAPASVDWIVPAAATNAKQTPADEDLARRRGRALPAPEPLQPTLDPALARYEPLRDSTLTGELRIAVSDTLPGLVRLWIRGFASRHPAVRIAVASTYDGNSAARQLAEGGADIAFISRALKPSERSAFSLGHSALSIPVASGSYRHFGFADALGIVVHRDNPLDRITYEQFDAIYSSTRYRLAGPITRWGQLGLTGDWADRPIHPYGVKPWDGFEDLLREKVLSVGDKRGDWRGDIRIESVFAMAGRVERDIDGIGYTGLAYLDANVKVLAIAQSATSPSVPPTYENAAQGTYPLTRPIFASVDKRHGGRLDPAVDEFLRFILSREGQRAVLEQAIFLPLREEQAARGRSMLSEDAVNPAIPVPRPLPVP